jgi:hypothetical protein
MAGEARRWGLRIKKTPSAVALGASVETRFALIGQEAPNVLEEGVIIIIDGSAGEYDHFCLEFRRL